MRPHITDEQMDRWITVWVCVSIGLCFGGYTRSVLVTIGSYFLATLIAKCRGR